MVKKYNLRHKEEGGTHSFQNSNTEDEDGDEDEKEESMTSQFSRKSTKSRREADSSQNYSSDFDHSMRNHSQNSSKSSESWDSSDHSFKRSGLEGKQERGRLYPDLSSHSDSSSFSVRRDYQSARKSPPRLPPGSRKSPLKRKSDSENGERESSYVWKICVAAIFGLLGYLAYNKLYSPQNKNSQQSDDDRFTHFADKILKLQDQFSQQDARFWRIIKSSVKHVLDTEEESYPAVVLIVTQRRDAQAAANVYGAIGELFEQVLQPSSPTAEPLSLNLTASLGREGADKQKLLLDAWMSRMLAGSHTAVVINHVESLWPDAALLLHGYCDGDNAPFKKAFLILGMYVEEPIHNAQQAETALRQLWAPDLSEDKIGALLSRVANNVAFFRLSANSA